MYDMPNHSLKPIATRWAAPADLFVGRNDSLAGKTLVIDNLDFRRIADQ
jgi:hypothetical protein